MSRRRDPKTGKTVEILERMILMARYDAQGILPSEIIKAIVEDERTQCSESAAWRTWQTRGEWLPKLVGAQEELGPAYAELVRDLKESIRLGLNAYHELVTSSNARVGALNVVGSNSAKLFKILERTGQIPTVPIQIEAKTEVEHDLTEEQLAEVLPVLVDMVMEESARRTDSDIPQEDLEEPLDTQD